MTIASADPRMGPANALQAILAGIRKVPPVYFIFLAVFIALGSMNQQYRSIPGVMNFLRTASPLAILAMGEMMVLALGGFDLSIGSIVTLVVLVSSLLLNNDPTQALPAILIMLGIGALIGVTNGLVVSYLKVPSFIATLGMMLLVRGGALYWVGGAPRGYLTDNWRMFGRNYIENVPVLGRVPIALLVLLLIGTLSYIAFHRTHLGKQILAIGDNVRAAQLSGVHVRRVRIMTFLICSVFAIVGGILTGGFGGVNVTIGEGLEMQAIAACVVGGVMLGGGKGSVPHTIFGAFTMQAIVNLLNLLGLPKPYKDVVQGLIIIAAVAYGAISTRRNR